MYNCNEDKILEMKANYNVLNMRRYGGESY